MLVPHLHTRTRHLRTTSVLMLSLIVAWALPALAAERQDDQPYAAPRGPDVTMDASDHGGSKAGESGFAAYWREHVSIHGYLSFGYADLDLRDDNPRSADEAALGLEEGGSFPYGNAALNLRYAPAERHAFVLQLEASELGDSPVDDAREALELDWLFYQLRIGDRTQMRIGRQPVPGGIFNELRDVGVVLPFFRPSFVFYREGAIFSETVDGIGLSHQLLDRRSWTLDLDAYYGEYTIFEQGSGFRDDATEVDATDAVGLQLWLGTPIEGLRVGVGGLRWDVAEESSFSREKASWDSAYASVDADLERFVVRVEARQVRTDVFPETSPSPIDVTLDIAYGQVGWHATDRLSFFAQLEIAEIKQRAAFLVGGKTRARNRRDAGVAVRYALRPNVVFKGELHDVASELNTGNEVVFTPAGPLLRPLLENFDSTYSIVSVALSF